MLKRKRYIALVLLLVALVAIIATGFYLGVTHQEERPTDTGAPGAASSSSAR